MADTMTERRPTHGVVRIREGAHGGSVIECPGESTAWLPGSALIPLPEPMTAEAKAVLDAVAAMENADATADENSGIHWATKNKVLKTYRAYRASIAPAPKVDSVVEELIAAGEAMARAQFHYDKSPSTKNGELKFAAEARWSSAVAAARAKGAAP